MSYEYCLLKKSRDQIEKSIAESGGIVTEHTLRHNDKAWCGHCHKEISLERLKKRGAYICAECD